MAVSQFTVYSSADLNGPGPINGITGSLITILDACLVNGYTNKPAAGWTKPLGTISGSLTCYTQPSGSGLSILVNDSGPNATSVGKEAWAIGWENPTSLTSSNITPYTTSVGSGFGQFPLPSQLLTTGHVVFRKSFTADTTGRSWVLLADAHTFYLWILTGDIANTYLHVGFGDVFSLYGTNDRYKCFLYGRALENSSAGADDWTEGLLAPGTGGGTSTAMPGHFIARTFGGFGFSTTICRKGDNLVAANYGGYGTTYMQGTAGSIITPNPPDGSYYLIPYSVVENSSQIIRGRWRGLYQVGHNPANFSDGQVFNGSGDFVGKRFMIIKLGRFGGFWAVEISNTVETN